MPEENDHSEDSEPAESPCPIPQDKVPRHIAIIMDGNGRWASERGLPRSKGHEVGVETVRSIVKIAGNWGIKTLTLYAFSSENWSRPKAEVGALMKLLSSYLTKARKELAEKNVRLDAIGDLSRLPYLVRRTLQSTIKATSKCDGMTLVLALSYGGRDEVVRAVRKMSECVKNGEIKPENITEEMISENLDTAGTPDPDLLVRTAGEMRISNFLLWQTSYSEYYSSSVCWPDFGAEQLAEALQEYVRRKRKFGGLETEK